MHPVLVAALRVGHFPADNVSCSIRFPPIRVTRMAIRVYRRLHPLVNFGPKEPPCLAHTFTQGIGRDDPVPGHLLNCSVMNTEHPRYLGIIYEVLDRL
jgi:hypothetical protein